MPTDLTSMWDKSLWDKFLKQTIAGSDCDCFHLLIKQTKSLRGKFYRRNRKHVQENYKNPKYCYR